MSTITRHESDARLSRAVVHNGVVYLAGLTADKRSAGMKEQTTEILHKIDTLLKTSGSDKSKLLSAMIYITDMRLKPAMDEAWLEWADAKNLPARACVEANMADPRHLVEIMVTACR
jgi:enamine deaminase RidA (YjgF/YER057c/UK114 family)